MSTSYNAFTCFGLKYPRDIEPAVLQMLAKRITGVTVVPVKVTQDDDLSPKDISTYSQQGTDQIVILHRASGQIKQPRFNPGTGQRCKDLVEEITEQAWVLLNGQLVEVWYNFSKGTYAFLANPTVEGFLKRTKHNWQGSCNVDIYLSLALNAQVFIKGDAVFITINNLFLDANQYNPHPPLTANVWELMAAGNELKNTAAKLAEFGFPKAEPQLYAEYTLD